MNLEEKLYTSTEVASILGVSLRSIYRYLEEGKLNAEIKTATGRLRFTRQDIMNFLQPSLPVKDSTKEAISSSEQVPSVQQAVPVASEPVADTVNSSVDWLSRFRKSSDTFKTPVEEVPAPQTAYVNPSVPTPPKEAVSALTDSAVSPKLSFETTFCYYKSLIGSLKDIAQNVDKVATKANVAYAFTFQAGLSLHTPLKTPFSMLHVYISSEHKELFEKMLQLVPSTEDNAQLCLLISNDPLIYSEREELHGLFVVSKMRLKKDLTAMGEPALADTIG